MSFQSHQKNMEHICWLSQEAATSWTVVAMAHWPSKLWCGWPKAYEKSRQPRSKLCLHAYLSACLDQISQVWKDWDLG